MRLSELMGREVLDSAGTRAGSVIDVRLIQDGPPQESGMARLRVAGLIVSPRRAGRLLGYERRPRGGPALIRKAVLAWTRGTVFVPWEWAELRDGQIHLTHPASALPPLEPLDTAN
jgi:sporulation protein YlmC with PRC-barrel domain